ncbi:DUF1501 domain-containing protein [Oleomonas cavernae]|uniref:DUF1501 domain-containing protein n=1 Tax=Oleomonas cavernae TaxID=2320859 RepID=UPI001314C09F|nr:hypothetical protein [Oleomonas cavernae]
MVRLDRRRFLISAGLGGLGLALGPRFALARIPGNKRLIVLVLRGGMDGLAAVPPYADPAYGATRGALALAVPGKSGGMIDLDGRFGLHPALQSAMPLWRGGEMQVLHATATPYRERSHFDAQNVLENGGTGPSGSATGWLNRAVAVAGGRGWRSAWRCRCSSPARPRSRPGRRRSCRRPMACCSTRSTGSMPRTNCFTPCWPKRARPARWRQGPGWTWPPREAWPPAPSRWNR